MSGFTLIQLKGVNSDDMKTRTPKVAVEIGNDCQLTFDWDEIFCIYIIFLSKFKWKIQLCFTTKVNLAHRLNATMKHI